MAHDVIAVFREVADRSPAEREAYYTRRSVPAAVRAEVESLLRFDGATLDPSNLRVAAAAYAFLQHGGRPTRALPGPCEPEVTIGPVAPALPIGVMFGPYRIVRQLGRGGMGTVYEADEIESGRRVALKVLAQLTEPSERERFEREGRLAASVNHPHCVFVFSAGEIHGHPVIVMEVMQGTLADRLEGDGALASPAAVDAILQLITGLQAAEAAGILHRDIKPSNCFVDAYGTVKIGDFGISRSLRPTQETAFSTRGHRPATPSYASPEQLRGAPVDVRSDIYSVGATLYELLTGRRPFDGADLMALLMAVANDVPAAPHLVSPDVPKGLSAIALRCLAKRPEERFPDYQTLAIALEPYSSAAPTPATLGRRCLAGCVDLVPLMLLNMLVSLWWGPTWLMHTPLLVMTAVNYLYFVGFEVRWQATPGKAVCGLVVVGQGGGPASIRSVIIRAGVFVMIPSLALQLLMLLSPERARSQRIASGFSETPETFRVEPMPDSVGFVANGLNFVMLGLLFSTARRRNSYAGLHDLLSRTRVAEGRARATRRVTTTVLADAQPGTIRRLGPFRVTSNAVSGMPEGWRSGFDERLGRPVWIREVPPGTPSISSERAAVNRPTRLRWIAGRRTEHEAWDAFEAVPGLPLDRAVTERRSWEDVRGWLLYLARECEAGSTADQVPRRPDRVWVLDAGGAKLVDDPAMDAPDRPPADDRPVAAFLLDVVRATRQSLPQRGGRRSPKAPPWPLGVHRFLDRLNAQPTPTPAAIIRELEALMRHPPSVTPGWRAMSLGVPMLLPVVLAPTIFIHFLYATTPLYPRIHYQVMTLLLAFVPVGCFAAHINALVFRGGVIRLLGLEFVTADGQRASRLRVLLRTAATWAPLIIMAAASSPAHWLSTACLFLVLAGAVIAILRPERGIQDRLAGTWIVPR